MKYRDPATGEFKKLYTKAADTLPVGTVVDYDGDEVPAGWEEAGSDDYSTEETFTGKYWIDGKKIYRRVVQIPAFSNSFVEVPIGSINIEQLIDCKASFIRPDVTDRIYPISNPYMGEWNINKIYGILNLITNNEFVTFSGYMILEYTKTTDAVEERDD